MDDLIPPVMADFIGGDRDVLVACCRPACGRELRLPPPRAAELFGPGCTILQARRRAVCSACGARGRDGFIDVRLDSLPRGYRPDPAPPYRT